jgi:hypothetical protein
LGSGTRHFPDEGNALDIWPGVRSLIDLADGKSRWMIRWPRTASSKVTLLCHFS